MARKTDPEREGRRGSALRPPRSPFLPPSLLFSRRTFLSRDGQVSKKDGFSSAKIQTGDMKRRPGNRGHNRLPKLVQTIAPSIPFPGRRFISPVCISFPPLDFFSRTLNRGCYFLSRFPPFLPTCTSNFKLITEHPQYHKFAHAAALYGDDKKIDFEASA